jgi:enoyl-CoA hydratase/carnithine racemase
VILHLEKRDFNGVHSSVRVATSQTSGELKMSAEHVLQKSAPIGGLEYLEYVEADGVGLLMINRPAVHNAIGLTTMPELERVLAHLETSPTLSALVLTGAGDKTFISGGDLKELEQLTTHQAAASMSRRMQTLMARLSDLPMPVIGAINGDSFGGGCEVALACDIRIAGSHARFAFKQVTIGITPAWGGRSRLVELVGRSIALRLMLTGEVIDAAEAMRIGLVDAVVEPASARDSALALAQQIAANPNAAVRAIKHQVNKGRGLVGERAIQFEADSFARTWVSDDHLKAVAAWKQRR